MLQLLQNIPFSLAVYVHWQFANIETGFAGLFLFAKRVDNVSRLMSLTKFYEKSYKICAELKNPFYCCSVSLIHAVKD